MAKPRVIVTRRKAVRNIYKITRTMQLIATSKFQRAHNRAVASKPYTEKVAGLVRTLATITAGQVRHPLLEEREPKVDLLLVLTSNRGLCGGYNSAVLRAALGHYNRQQELGRHVRIEVVGKKGILYLKFLGWPIESGFTHIGDKPTFQHVEELAKRYIELFANQRAIETVHVAYMRFVSAGVQRPTVVQLLPLGGLDAEGGSQAAAPGAQEDSGHGSHEAHDSHDSLSSPQGDAHAKPGGPVKGFVHSPEDYDLSPSAEELLADLLPLTLKVRLFQYLNDAVVSEQVARMTAMKAATENAGDMIKLLTQQYNRARQAQITKELAEIMGGAEALK